MARFKIGDRVRIMSHAGGYFGGEGTITGVQRAPDAQNETEILPGYVVQLDKGQLEFFIGEDLELK